MRRARQSPNQSWPMKVGLPGMRSLALTRRPEAGLVLCGRASPLAKPVQSNAPSAPGTGVVPSPDRRMGTRPVVASAMPVRSATSRFWTGAVIRGAACRASSIVAARLSASRPEAAVSPGASAAMATARMAWGWSSRSLMTGPCRVSRTVITWSGAPRTPMVSLRVSNGRGPSGVA